MTRAWFLALLAPSFTALLLGQWVWRNRPEPRIGIIGTNSQKANTATEAEALERNLRSDDVPDFEELLEKNPELGMKTIFAALERSDSETRLMAVVALRELEEPTALPGLGKALTDPDPYIKRYALMALAEREEPEVVALLSLALNDSEPEFRIEALEALAEKGEEGLRAIRLALSEQNRKVRERARELLDLPSGNE